MVRKIYDKDIKGICFYKFLRIYFRNRRTKHEIKISQGRKTIIRPYPAIYSILNLSSYRSTMEPRNLNTRQPKCK